MDHKDELSFIGMLIMDVGAADKRCKELGTQAARRDFVRASFAAVEGIAWIFREHVRSLAETSGLLEDAERLALAETTFQVSATGKISTHPRFLSLVATVRLCARIADRMVNARCIDFAENGWEELLAAIAIRNRITHPKSRDDLILEEGDVSTCANAFFWFLEQITSAMATSNNAVRQFSEDMVKFLTQLKAGDPVAWAAYKAIRYAERNDD